MRIALLCLFLFSGCTITNVKPWQKATLADERFNQGACSKEFAKFQNHVYFSKEGSKGGGGVAGGGCGCN